MWLIGKWIQIRKGVASLPNAGGWWGLRYKGIYNLGWTWKDGQGEHIRPHGEVRRCFSGVNRLILITRMNENYQYFNKKEEICSNTPTSWLCSLWNSSKFYSNPEPCRDQPGGARDCPQSDYPHTDASLSPPPSFSFPFHSSFPFSLPLATLLWTFRPYSPPHTPRSCFSLVMGSGARTLATRTHWTVRTAILKVEAEGLGWVLSFHTGNVTSSGLESPSIPMFSSSEGKLLMAADPTGALPTKDVLCLLLTQAKA